LSTIHHDLLEKLSCIDDHQKIDVVVHMKDQMILSQVSGNLTITMKVRMLQNHAQVCQEEILSCLKAFPDDIADVKSFWIFNGLSMKTTRAVIYMLAEREDVEFIALDDHVYLDDDNTYMPVDGVRTPEWNISKIKADSCWLEGYTGSNIVVGTLDSGVDTSHVSVRGKWVIGGWFDAVNGLPYPYDDQGHGLFILGIICGGDGLGPMADDIGVAPGAKFICAKAFDSVGAATNSAIHSCFQWFATREVKIVVAPWTENLLTSLEFWNDCLNLRDLGIIIVFKIGTSSNAPPGSAKTPANYPTVLGIGATDSLDDRINWSCRGPAPNQYPWNDTSFWFRSDWDSIKPDIVAPGVYIRSALLGGGYSIANGTAWSAAHAGGAIVILLQKDSTINIDSLVYLLTDYADHPSQGGTYPNHDYGWGRLNVYAALHGMQDINETILKMPFANSIMFPSIFRKPLHIRVMQTDDQDASILIYDVSGRCVKKINIDNKLYNSDQNFVWDGYSDSGESVASGVFFIELLGRHYREVKKAILVD
jgi:bacillopeptidase F